MVHVNYLRTLAAAVLLTACGGEPDAAAEADATSAPTQERRTDVPTVLGDLDEPMTAEQLARDRRDPSWRGFVELDSVALQDTAQYPEAWDDISPESLNREQMFVPLYGDVAGPAVLRTQILLDRAHFSPGVMDGYWGKNTEEAVYWFQKRYGLPATGRVDRATFERLVERAGTPRQVVVQHRLTEEDLAGPYVDIPEDIYDKAELECMCYESQAEKLAEMFHTTHELLQQLNPGVDLLALRPGQTLAAPNVAESGPAPQGEVARIVISDGAHYLHAVDAEGTVLYHYPTTLGSDYAPSPTGEFRITAIAHEPDWHYQPDLLTGVPDHKDDAIIPPGPNNAVGVVWMQLSKPHYGIHGTSAPETIGYATSHGCVRLTNWDAAQLSRTVSEGTPVEFRDVTEL